MKKFAIIIGHTSKQPGAASPHGIPPEYFFNNKVAQYLTDIADIYYYDSYSGGYISMVKRLFNHINKHDYKMTLELHYNAASPSAEGTEVLHYETSKGGAVHAKTLSKMISDNFGTRNRGAKPRSRSGRGGYALYAGKPIALLLEPFFGSNKNDTLRFKGKEKEYAEVIREFLNKV